MYTVGAIISAVYIFAALKGPFPYWHSYIRIWRALIRNSNAALGYRVRLRLTFVLLRIAAVSPIYNLLWLVDDLLYPGYRSCKFEGPIFVIGPPRSGTTFLHRTLAEDDAQFLGVRHIEWRFPFIFVQKFMRWTGLKAVFSRIPYWPSGEAGRLARKMHNHTLGDYEEDGIFFEERFLYHYFIFRRFPCPELLGFLHDYSALPNRVAERMLAVHEKVLRKVTYLRGGGACRVVLKENESMQMLRVMAKRYPDSKFILLTRRSADFLSSYVALSRVSTHCKTGIDPMPIPNWHHRNVRKRFDECADQMQFFNQELPSERQVRLSYDILSSHLALTILYIYRCLGIQVSVECLTRLAVIDSTQKGRRRGYELEPFHSAEFDLYDRFAEDVFQDHETNLRRLSACPAPQNQRAAQRVVD